MKRTWIGIFAAVVTAGTLLAAQEAAQNAKGDDQKNQPAATTTVDQTVTYTGCLEAGPAPGTYVLSNATEVKQTTTSSTTRSANAQTTTTTTTTATANPSFKILGTPVGFNLDANLNHKVQVSGSFSETTKSAAVTPAARPAEPRTQPQPEPRTEPVPPAPPTPTPNEPRVEAQPMPQAPAASTQVVMKSITIKSAKSLADRCAELYH